jgi:hypothetical protein
MAKATDNEGAESTSQVINVVIAPLMMCTETSSEALQGTFTIGYICTYQTVGTDVIITFELLDDKTGVVAYLWKQNPFSEVPMTNVGDNIFSYTLTGQTIGSTISYACKFAYAGGMAVTKYISYEVGENCINTIIENPSALPLTFFPNPVKDEFTIRGLSESATISVYDLNGIMVFNKTSGSCEEKINVSGLAHGLYIIKVTDKKGTATCKLLKQ